MATIKSKDQADGDTPQDQVGVSTSPNQQPEQPAAKESVAEDLPKARATSMIGALYAAQQAALAKGDMAGHALLHSVDVALGDLAMRLPLDHTAAGHCDEVQEFVEGIKHALSRE